MIKLLILGKTSYVGVSVKKYIECNHNDVEVTIASSRDNEWKKLDFGKYDVVYNVSGLCHADSKHGTPEQYMSINGQLPIDMGKKVKQEGCRLFINMSSSIVYGNMSHIGESKIMRIDEEPKPVNVYGESKLYAEKGLLELEDEKFGVALIRAPLIYGENATGNFALLVKFAKITPFFPDIENRQSMIYIDNLCELVYLISCNNVRGVFCPQDSNIICTSKFVKDLASVYGRKVHLTKVFNPILKLLSKRIYFIEKAFGNMEYAKSSSDHFNCQYQVVDYERALKRLT